MLLPGWWWGRGGRSLRPPQSPRAGGPPRPPRPPLPPLPHPPPGSGPQSRPQTSRLRENNRVGRFFYFMHLQCFAVPLGAKMKIKKNKNYFALLAFWTKIKHIFLFPQTRGTANNHASAWRKSAKSTHPRIQWICSPTTYEYTYGRIIGTKSQGWEFDHWFLDWIDRFFVIDRSIRSWKRSNRSRRSFLKIEERRSMRAIRSFGIKRRGNCKIHMKNTFFWANHSFFESDSLTIDLF